MSNMSGMDVGQVDSMGHQMQGKSDEIRQIIGVIDGLVNQIPGVWRGHDADQFKGWWQNEHRRNLTQVAEQLHGLGQSAINNAREQANVSSH